MGVLEPKRLDQGPLMNILKPGPHRVSTVHRHQEESRRRFKLRAGTTASSDNLLTRDERSDM